MYIIFNILKLEKIKTINHKNINLKFMITNHITQYRADTFSSKEPKTLKWIEQFEDNKCFWDVGANVGLYSIYAKLNNQSTEVISFEPSFKNLNLLNYNLFLNNLSNSISIFSLPLSGENNFQNFVIGDDLDGGANSTLKSDSDFQLVTNQNSYRLFSITIDKLINGLNVHSPDYLKIDVDGNELDILDGINNNFKNIKEILIEVNNFEKDTLSVENFLKNYKFKLVDIEKFGSSNKTANLIFKK